MELQDAYKEKMSAQLKEWNAQIHWLETKVESAGADVKLKHAWELNELRAKHRLARKKMRELGKASEEAWVEVKETADTIWNDLKIGIAEAQAKFR